MTAEVIIMNKTAAAIAADSAVTVPAARGDKVYNSANKIFTLSKYEPVGIVIYNSTEFTTKPWETVIKEFREKIKNGYGLSLKDYVTEFLKYLENGVPVSQAEEKENVRHLSIQFAMSMFAEFREDCIYNGVVISEKDIKGDARRILWRNIQGFRRSVSSAKTTPSMGGVTPTQIKSSFEGEILDGILRVFDPFSPLKREKDGLIDLFCELCCSNFITDAYTGFSIVGFGRDDYYPSAYHFYEEGRICGCTKIIPQRPSMITLKNDASIIPLAQRDMTDSFIEGIDRTHREYVEAAITSFIEGIPDAAQHFLGGISGVQKGVFRRSLRRELKRLIPTAIINDLCVPNRACRWT